MRERNWWLVRVGGVLLVFAVVVLVAMLVIFPPSPETAEMIHRVGQITGAVGGAGVALMIVGVIGRKVPAGESNT
jgi:succinate dehydrogenase hydrophobic anchor subunit